MAEKLVGCLSVGHIVISTYILGNSVKSQKSASNITLWKRVKELKSYISPYNINKNNRFTILSLFFVSLTHQSLV